MNTEKDRILCPGRNAVARPRRGAGQFLQRGLHRLAVDAFEGGRGGDEIPLQQVASSTANAGGQKPGDKPGDEAADPLPGPLSRASLRPGSGQRRLVQARQFPGYGLDDRGIGALLAPEWKAMRRCWSGRAGQLPGTRPIVAFEGEQAQTLARALEGMPPLAWRVSIFSRTRTCENSPRGRHRTAGAAPEHP
jgi:hypothetical protein